MAASQSSTIPIAGLGPLAEMEDKERSSLASSIKSNGGGGGGGGGGGRKRKMEEQEDDPNFLQNVSGRRLAMLDAIVCVLKCFNSVIRFRVPADGDLGFSLETGSMEEQWVAGLIFGHVCSYIQLYHLEKKKANGNNNIIEEMVKLADEGEVIPDGRVVDELVGEVEWLEFDSIQSLMDGVRALVDDPSIRLRNGNRGTMDISSTFDELGGYTKGCRKQELLDVLHTLEVIGHARGYAPPEDDEEIMCYREIRKQITYYLAHVLARDEFLNATGQKRSSYFQLHDPFSKPPDQEALCFIPAMHQLEVSFEHMPEHLALLKECKRRVTQLLSSGPTPVADRVHDIVAIMQAKDVARSALLMWKPKKESFVKTRSDCLESIIGILRRIKPFCEQTPTEEEVRMYAHIGEHIRSSNWLSRSVEYSQKKDKRSCEVYIANVFTDHDHSLLSKSDAQGEHVCTREQLLEQIMAYLRAIKASCLDDVPSLEEESKYDAIWRMLYPGLCVCLRSRTWRTMLDVDEETEEISELELFVLERKLCYIYKRVIGFLEEVKEEICSIAAVVHSALRPEEQLSPEGALNWFMTCKDDVATKVKEFVDGSQSLGSMANLELALLMLVDTRGIGLFFFKLSDAVPYVDWAWRDGKKYAMVASEVENAIGVIRSEKPFVK